MPGMHLLEVTVAPLKSPQNPMSPQTWEFDMRLIYETKGQTFEPRHGLPSGNETRQWKIQDIHGGFRKIKWWPLPCQITGGQSNPQCIWVGAEPWC